MKFTQLICALLVFIAIVSATSDFHGNNQCSIKQQQISSWSEGDMMVYQFSATITNHSNKMIKSIHIATDHTLCLRDNSSIWNIQKLSNGDLTLANGQTIAAYGSHTFYFILKNSIHANLFIKSVDY